MSEKRRDQSIDILKCLAALMITNSHMELLYGDYSILATGGAIGDVLFFFCSGYTLFLGKGDTFDNWYKRRINRIYPTVFAWALVVAVVFGKEMNMYEILVSGGWMVCLLYNDLLRYSMVCETVLDRTAERGVCCGLRYCVGVVYIRR